MVLHDVNKADNDSLDSRTDFMQSYFLSWLFTFARTKLSKRIGLFAGIGFNLGRNIKIKRKELNSIASPGQ